MSLNNQTPQLEDGFTRIANEILEALSRTNLTSYQTRILWFIFRKTYGYHKKEDWISVQQIVEGTGIRQSHVSRTKKELTQRGIIYTPDGIKIAFQKDSTKWKNIPNEVYRKKYIPQQVKHIPHKVLNIPQQGHTKDNIQKIITKDINNGASSQILELKTLKEQLANKLSYKNNVGLHTQWQSEAFRIAEKLKINLDIEFKGRWLIVLLKFL